MPDYTVPLSVALFVIGTLSGFAVNDRLHRKQKTEFDKNHEDNKKISQDIGLIMKELGIKNQEVPKPDIIGLGKRLRKVMKHMTESRGYDGIPEVEKWRQEFLEDNYRE